MKLIVFVFVVSLYFTLAFYVETIFDEFIDDELYFGLRPFFNTTHKDCVWRNWYTDRKLCPREVKITLFTGGRNESINVGNKDWLNSSAIWDSNKENMFFVHGYAGGDNSLPQVMLRDAFILNGQHNLFLVEHGPVSRAPCYVPLVQNIKYVSYCLASYLNNFYRSGMSRDSITCIGHSMGAHICGLLRHNLKFRLQKIIGLDPALPLITNNVRLTHRDAELVYTLQTNAGNYGDIGSIGHTDVCVNNGNMQPYCLDTINPNLCSHINALCIAAETLFSNSTLYAKKCTKVCPHISVFQIMSVLDQFDDNKSISNTIEEDQPNKILVNPYTRKNIRGSYCLAVTNPPFCPKYFNGIGHSLYCNFQASEITAGSM